MLVKRHKEGGVYCMVKPATASSIILYPEVLCISNCWNIRLRPNFTKVGGTFPRRAADTGALLILTNICISWAIITC